MTRKSSLWNDYISSGSGSDAQEQEEVEEVAQRCRDMDEEPKPTVKTFIANATDNVKPFLENHGFHQEAGTMEML